MLGNLINNALSTAKKYSSQVMSMISKDVQVYDASKNSIKIADLEMTGWEYATISEYELTKEYSGLTKDEIAIVKQVYVRKLTISFLPTEISNERLESLAAVCMSQNKFFKIIILENGVWVGDYNAQFASNAAINLAHEAENRTWEFYIIPTNTAVVQNSQVVNLPVAVEPPTGN